MAKDVLREMIREFAQRMMDADVEVRCGAGYGEVSPDRVNCRNGYRRWEWDTRAGTIELAIPELRSGSYFPGFLEHWRRGAGAGIGGGNQLPAGRPGGRRSWPPPSASPLVQVAGQRDGRGTGRAGGGVPVPAAGPRAVHVLLDRCADPEGPRGRPDGERALRLIATGVNADGCREILCIDVTSSEDGAGWLAFLRGRPGRPGLSGVQPVTSDTTQGWSAPSPRSCPAPRGSGAGRTTNRNLLTRVLKPAQPTGDDELTNSEIHHGTTSRCHLPFCWRTNDRG
jgi:putative transposase